jgi:hypothetical protein
MSENIFVYLIIGLCFLVVFKRFSATESARKTSFSTRTHPKFESTKSTITHPGQHINAGHDNTVALTAMGVAAGLTGAMVARELAYDFDDDDTPIAQNDINLFGHEDHCNSINPATDLPMVDGSIDVHGNPYGTDINEHHDDSMSLHSDDHWSHTDDSFNNDSWTLSDFDD